jgi:type IV pilus assembly protein PilE
MSRGFSLLEILFVLVMVGILAALALPALRQQSMRVHRSEAMTALLQLQLAEEKYYLRHGAYTGDIFSTPPAGLGLPPSASGRYLLSVALAADAQSFIASATPAPSGGQEADHECLAFSIDARGRRAVSGTRDAGSCWK